VSHTHDPDGSEARVWVAHIGDWDGVLPGDDASESYRGQSKSGGDEVHGVTSRRERRKREKDAKNMGAEYEEPFVVGFFMHDVRVRQGKTRSWGPHGTWARRNVLEVHTIANLTFPLLV
jgi:hypothetical protein